MKSVMVVLSGGQDSVTCMYWAREKYGAVHALTIDYGQRHSAEIEAARKTAQMCGVSSHEVIDVPGILRSTSPLVSDNTLETYESHDAMEKIIGDRVEVTFVPMRNAFFLMLAANRAVAKGCDALVTGVCEADNANYPDCRQVFIDATERTINLALGKTMDGDRFRILTPLMYRTKAQTVELAARLTGCMDALAYSHTAYSGEYPPLTQDHATVLRAHGFLEAGLPDPLIVRAWREGLMALPTTSNYDALHEGEATRPAAL